MTFKYKKHITFEDPRETMSVAKETREIKEFT